MNAVPRYAIYFTPCSDTALWRFGCAAIGYDAQTGAATPLLELPGIDGQRRREIAADPSRYGFHATLKAPFELARGTTREQLVEAAGTLAASTPTFTLGGLRVSALGSFLALTTMTQADEARLRGLAQVVVEGLDGFRAPLGPHDRARRLEAGLSPRQVELLDRWGYHYVEEQFRFHMTLTGRLTEAEIGPVGQALAGHHARMAANGPVAIDALSVLEQPARHDQFRIIARLEMA